MNLNNSTLEVSKEQYTVKDVSELELPEYIDKPEYVKRKTAGYGLMAVGWMLWMWLFIPLLTLLFWWFEGTVVYTQVVMQSKPMTGISVLKLIVCIGIFIGCLFIWASYNWARFHGEDRRKAAENVNATMLAISFSVQEDDILKMRKAKNITLHYSDEGELEDFKIGA